MLTIEAVPDVISDVDLVDDLVGIFLQGGCEDDDLIVLCHCLDELDAARSHQKEAIVLIFNVMDQGFIEIEYKCVDRFLTGLERIKEGWRNLGQIGKVVGEDGLAGRCDGRGFQNSKWILSSQAGLALITNNLGCTSASLVTQSASSLDGIAINSTSGLAVVRLLS